jgi:hypothetical protein
MELLYGFHPEVWHSLWLEGCANLADHKCIQRSMKGSSYWLSYRQTWQQQEKQQQLETSSSQLHAFQALLSTSNDHITDL